MAVSAAKAVGDALGSSPSPASMVGSMVSLQIPLDGPLGGPAAAGQSSPLEADPLQTLIYDRFAIEVPIGPWPVPAAEAPEPPRRVIRVSIALHNDPRTSIASSTRSGRSRPRLSHGPSCGRDQRG